MVIGAVLPKIHLTLKLQVRTSRNISAAVNRVRTQIIVCIVIIVTINAL